MKRDITAAIGAVATIIGWTLLLFIGFGIYPPAPDDHAEETLLELVRVADAELLACRVSLERELRWRERAAMYLDSAFGGEAIR